MKLQQALPGENLEHTDLGPSYMTSSEEARAAREASPSLLGAAWRGNILPQAINSIQRNSEFPPDPDYTHEKKMEDYKQLSQGIPFEMHKSFVQADSKAEMEDIRATVVQQMRDADKLQGAGMKGILASIAVGVLDVDTLLALGPAMKMFGASVRAGTKVGAGAIKSAELAAAAEEATMKLAAHTAKAKPRVKWAANLYDDTAATLKQQADDAVKTMTEFNIEQAKKTLAEQPGLLETLARGAEVGGLYGAAFGAGEWTFNPNGGPEDLVGGLLYGTALGLGLGGGAGVVGKAQANKLQAWVKEAEDNFKNAYNDPRFGDVVKDVPDFSKSQVWASEDDSVRSAAISESAARIVYNKGKSFIADMMDKVMNKLPIGPDSHKLMNSKSEEARVFAFHALETPSGAWQRTDTAAVQAEVYTGHGLQGIAGYADNYNAWGKSKGANLLERVHNKDLQEQFNRELIQEMSRRWVGGNPSDVVAHPAVHRQADALDIAGEYLMKIGKGAPGEIPLYGFENLLPRKGYFPLIWHGVKMSQATSKFGENAVKTLLTNAYRGGGIDQETAEVLAAAVIRRGKDKIGDLEIPVQRAMNHDQAEFVQQFLLDNKVPDHLVDRVTKYLMGEAEEASRAGFTKHRTPIDMNAELKGMTVYDLIDTDVYKVWTRYSRVVGKQSALARLGLNSKTKIDAMKKRIHDQDPDMDPKFLDDILSHFRGGPIAGGVSDVTRRIVMSTALTFLNQVGLAQLAETGVTMSALGMRRFMHYAPTMKTLLSKDGPKHPMWEDWRWLGGNLIDEHLLRNDALASDYAREGMKSDSKFWAAYDRMLAKGVRAQGYYSGQYKIRQWQTSTLVPGMTDKLLSAIKGSGEMSAARLADSGFDPAFIQKIRKKYIDTGLVEWAPSGYVNKVNFQQWDTQDALQFQMNMYRLTHQNIQKALAGEDSRWLHKDSGTLLGQFMSFPIVAMQKQFARNFRVGDFESVMSFTYGLATAGMAYGIRQIINGKYDELTPERLAYGALFYSNMTGFVPTITNPLAYMFGLDEFQMGPSSGRGAIGQPPSWQFIESVVSLPRAAIHAAQGDFTKKDAAVLRSGIPMLGNMYGFPLIWNSLVDE